MVEHWAWIPMVTCVVLVLLWLTGCTMVSISSSQGGATPSRTTPFPRLTITVYERQTLTPIPNPDAITRIAVQPSPQPSPPPRIHIIEENDTLLDIAYQYEVDFEALLLANPGIDPGVLQIGQEIVIPTDDTPQQQAIAPLTLRPPTCYSIQTNSLECLGMVKNDLDDAAEQVGVEVELLDNGGGTIANGRTMLEQAFLPAGEAAPYRVLFPQADTERVGRVRATLRSGTLTDTADERFSALVLENVQFTRERNAYRLSAQVRNPGERPLRLPRVVVTLLDAEGQVYGYRTWEGAANLLPGQRLAIQMSLVPIPADAPPTLTYQLHTEARFPSE